MNKGSLEKYIGHMNLSITDAMSMIDKNTKGLLFIVNGNEQLVGCVTDGNIRRWLLKTGNLKASVEDAMNSNPVYLTADDLDKARTTMMAKHITSVPIISEEHKIIDIVFLSEDNPNVEPVVKDTLKDVPIVIMAGGKGTRLYPYTKILPKPLIPIKETPIVERILDSFARYGVEKFYMTVNYKKGMIKSYFADLNPDYEICYVEESKPLGTGGSIKLIEDKLTRPIIVANCDSLIVADYSDIYKHHVESGNEITIVASLKNVTIPYGVLHTASDGHIESMEEKPKLSYLINTGMYIVNPELIELIPDDTMFHMPNLVEMVMARDMKVGIYPVSEDSFLDMGEFSEMKRMEDKLAEA